MADFDFILDVAKLTFSLNFEILSFMKIVNGIKTVVKPFVDIPSWIGYKQLADSFKNIAGVCKEFFIPEKPEKPEAFSEAMNRLNLTEEQIQQRAKDFKRLTIIFAIFTVIVFAYAVYLLCVGSLRGFMGALGVTAIVAAYTFRYHFWLFQVQQRKLGCTLRDWWDSGITGGKK